MSKKSDEKGQVSIKKNFAYSVFFQVFTMITPLITTPYMARVFGADGTGINSYTASIISYFAMFSLLGTASYGQREIAMCRDDKKERSKTFFEIELLSFITTGICLVTFFVFLIFYTEYRIFLLAQVFTIIGVAFDISWFYAGLEQFKYAISRGILIRIIGIVFLFVCIKDKDDLFLYIIVSSILGMVSLMSMWMFLPRFVEKVKIDVSNLKKHLKETLVFFIPSVATSIYTVLDKTMIGAFTGEPVENGYYEQCNRVVLMTLVLTSSLNKVMSSRMAYLYKKGRYDEIREKLKSSMDFTVLLSFPLVMGVIFVARDFVPVFFGEGYDKVILLLYYYSPLILIISLSSCLGTQCLTPCGRRKKSSYALIAGACLNLVMNLFLIPMFSSVGATIASLAAEGLITVLYFYLSRDYIGVGSVIRLSVKPVIGTVAMLGALYAYRKFVPIDNAIILLVSEIAVGALVYGVFMLVMKESLVIHYTKSFLGRLKRG